MRRAVIDVGTNTVKLLVADVDSGLVTPVFADDTTTRLGEGLQRSGRLSPAAIARTVEAIGRYAEQARALGAIDLIAVTTNAARSATNAEEFLRASPVPVQVISGEREAELIFRGVCTDPAWRGEQLLVMDVGGGSSEWIVGCDGAVERKRSAPVGAVRLREQFGDDLAAMKAFLRAELAGMLEPFQRGWQRMIGTGGTIVTLARMAGQEADRARLGRQDIREWAERLHAMPLAERRGVPGLPPERADIIVAGAALFGVAMEVLGATELTVSVRALRFGLLAELR